MKMILALITTICVAYAGWNVRQRTLARLAEMGRDDWPDDGPGEDPIVDPPEDPEGLDVDWQELLSQELVSA